MPTTTHKFFSYSHLPEHLQKVSKRFSELADFIEDNLPDCAEKSVAMRKLLESKDAAVRAETERKNVE